MKEYHKIQSIFKRDQKGNFLYGTWTLPAFEYLQGNKWIWDEKIDGTNIRVNWDGEQVRFGGRTDRALLYIPLFERLQKLFTPEKMKAGFPDVTTEAPITLYGEGYGARIQKGGGLYIPDGVDFILFDIRVGHWWLKREDIKSIASELGIKTTPIVGEGNLIEAINFVKSGFQSKLGDLQAEGLVLRPAVPLTARNGNRIITKIKTKDFK